jgi:hypothetical protein
MPSKRRTAMNTPRKFRAAVFTAVLAVVSLAPALQAQTHPVSARVNVPFAFETGNRHFEPGVYTISMKTPNVLIIKGTSGSSFVLMHPAGNVKQPAESKVVFRRSGDRYFLGQIWIADRSGYMEVVKSNAERKLQVAEQKSAPADNVELALLETAR